MTSSVKKGDAEKACSEPDQSTKGFYLQQTMMRIKDPRISLDFYTRVLGMRLLAEIDIPDMQFTVFFMGYCESSSIPSEDLARKKWALKQPRNPGIDIGDTDDNFAGYHNGNKEPGRGFGHIGLYVPDVYAACNRFEELKVSFIKAPDAGNMKGLAFIQDPDGYWIEILNEKILK